jgi:vacuolar protein sorting-associated protein 72
VKRDRPVANKLTQEELLAEAALTEEKNRDSLLEWQQKEAERKENAKKKDKKGITGSFVRYHSFPDGLINGAKTKELVMPTSDQEGNTESENITDPGAIDWQIKKDMDDYDLMGRNLITFVESDNDSGAETDKNLDLADLVNQLVGWLDKSPKPNKPILCPITGEVAKYRDPHTDVPYANLQAYNTIKSCLNHEMNWSTSIGLYSGNLPSADGVPEEWKSTKN